MNAGRACLLTVCSISILAGTAQATSIRINGTCVSNNCQDPDILQPGHSAGNFFNVDYTLPNTDAYQLVGWGYGEPGDAGGGGAIGFYSFAAFYLGNNTGTASATDTFHLSLSQNFLVPLPKGPVVGGTDVEGIFAMGAGPGSFASASGFYNGRSLGTVETGSLPSWDDPFTGGEETTSYSDGVPVDNLTLLLDLTFEAGTVPDGDIDFPFRGDIVDTGVGPVPSPPPSEVPEPSTLTLLGTGAVGIGRLLMRAKRSA